MKKMFALFAAVMMLSVPVWAEEANFTGDWYGSFNGAVIKMTVNEDGTYILDFAGELQDGTWAPTDEGIQLDDDAIGILTEEGLEITGEDDSTMTFGRDEIENFVPAEIDYEADLELLQGKWSAYKFGTNGTYIDITPENESYMEMEITGTTVEMNGFYFDDVTIEMDNQDGGLSKFFQDESEMFQILAVNYLTDGTLRLGLTVSLEDEEQMEYLFVPAQEAETEAITE